MRRTNEDQYKYEFKRSGAFGVFQSNGSTPVEYLMTTLTIDEIPNLSFARDINSSLNFDYLIQRDIDQDRALGEISRYITSTEGTAQKEIVFLPPLLVSIVETDSKNDLIEYYPDSKFNCENDDFGDVYTREWPGLFKVTNYSANTGSPFKFETVLNGSENKNIDYGQAKIEINLTKKKMKGGKLVVIDGQHRLFALEHLRVHEYNKVENIVLPVCIIYSANSCVSFGNVKQSAPSIPSLMRSLFVDVNSTVERVSGHFLTLLQDNTLGSIICRDFCSSILANTTLGTNALALVEWNTKNHKESLTITREHTLTSIGVLNSAFEESFKSASGIKLISEIIGLKSRVNDFDFGVDEYDQIITMPKEFPWRDFSLKHKTQLTSMVHSTITQSLARVFFETKPFKQAFEIFNSTLDRVISEVIADRDPLSTSAEIVKNHILFNDPISSSEKSAKALLIKFLEEYKAERAKVFPALARKTIFQKSIIETWYKLLEVMIPRGKDLNSVTDLLIKLIEKSLELDADLFEMKKPHVQGTIFDGNRVKVTKECKNQLSRLTLSKLSDIDFVRMSCPNNEPEAIIECLYNLGVKELSTYYNKMIKDKKLNFVKSYKSNFSIPSYEREKLLAEEEKRDAKLKIATNSSERLDASRGFDELVMQILSEEFELADKSLAKSLNKKDSSIVYIINGSEDE